MNTSRLVLAGLIGAVLSAALILACGDDHPPAADAASACDCPKAEPPLAGRIEFGPVRTESIDPREVDIIGEACPTPGSIPLGASCRGGPHTPLISSFKPDGIEGWQCEWRNDTSSAENATFQVMCLKPAPMP